MTHHRLPKAPHGIFDASGRPNYGVYRGAIENIPTDLAFTRRRLQRKTWMYLGVFHPNLYAAFAIVDAGYAANAFAYCYQPHTNHFVEAKLIRPFGFETDFDPTLDSEWSLGDFTIKSEGDTFVATCSRPELNLTLTVQKNRSHGISAVAPMENRPFNFTFKNAACAATATMQANDNTYTVDGDIGAIDFSKGYPPRTTRWKWASMVGTLEDGRSLGVNLVAEHNDDMENAYWLDGVPFPVSTAAFRFDPVAPDVHAWEVTTDDGALKLLFTPQKMRSERINLGVVRHHFLQPCGTFEGYLKHAGESFRFHGHGVTESHLSIW